MGGSMARLDRIVKGLEIVEVFLQFKYSKLQIQIYPF